nr:ribose-phosphate pyrophosphokinase [Candidatus Woesebacteria bacterium]
ADAILVVLLLIDAARRASAEAITVVQPFASYQRADRKDKPRVPITAARLPQLLVHAGADRLITVDNHSAQQQGYIKEPWDELYASYSLVPAIRELGFSSGVLLSPDAGGTKRADYYAHILTASSLAFIYKRRRRSDNSSIAVELVGDVVGKDVLIVDDIIASGSTVFHAAELAAKCGARRIFVAVAHGLFLGDFLKKLDSSPIEKVLVTNSLPHPIEITQHPKIQVVPIEPLLSEAIRRTYTGESLNEALFPKFDATI